MRFVLQQSGLIIPDFIGIDGVQRPIRHASEFWDHYGVSTHEPEKGDLVLFSRNGKFPTHIGIMRDPESYIHAPGQDGTKVCIAALTLETIRRKDYVQRARHLYTVNPIGFKAPVVPVHQPTYRYHQEVAD